MLIRFKRGSGRSSARSYVAKSVGSRGSNPYGGYSVSNIQTKQQAKNEIKRLREKYDKIDNEIISNQGIVSDDSQRIKSLKAKRADISLNMSRVKNRAKLMKKDNIDTDGDGVKNYKDCQPFNPKKQGLLHDFQLKRLKAQEQKLEEQRIKIQKKTESQREILDQKLAIAKSKKSIRQAQMSQKQKVIDEINKEKQEIKNLKEANRQAKRDIFNKSPTGKAVNVSKKAIDQTRAYFNKPSTKKSISKFLKKLG